MVLGPLLAGFLDRQGSMRRTLFGLAGVVLLTLNHKMGLQLTLEEQGIIAGFITTLVISSNAKEMVFAHSNAKVNTAVALAQAAATQQTEKEE